MKPRVICFGEILWDLLPGGKVAGGAPMNVAFQLNQLGMPSGMISAIGTDDLGSEIHNFLQSKRVPSDLVQKDTQRPTGVVQVSLNEKGHPSYDIVQQVAWDFIALRNDAGEAVANAEALVFGSLVARSETSKNTLLAFIEKAPFRVFDVNLRKPFYSPKLLEELLPTADLVKMNDDELEIIAQWCNIPGDQEAKMTALKKAFQLDLLVVTKGENGAISLGETGFCRHLGYRVQVNDTIGSGDAFLAGYLFQFLGKNTPEKCLDFACKMGAYVATKRGGTPELDPRELTNLSLKGY